MTVYPNYPIRPATLQEAFDAAALHVLRTGQPSVGAPCCVYSGHGCAMRPFIPQDEASLRWMDRQGELSTILEDEDWERYLSLFIRDRLGFFNELQDAHDAGAMGVLHGRKTVESWLAEWKAEMQDIAARYDLDASLITDSEALAQ